MATFFVLALASIALAGDTDRVTVSLHNRETIPTVEFHRRDLSTEATLVPGLSVLQGPQLSYVYTFEWSELDPPTPPLFVMVVGDDFEPVVVVRQDDLSVFARCESLWYSAAGVKAGDGPSGEFACPIL